MGRPTTSSSSSILSFGPAERALAERFVARYAMPRSSTLPTPTSSARTDHGAPQPHRRHGYATASSALATPLRSHALPASLATLAPTAAAPAGPLGAGPPGRVCPGCHDLGDRRVRHRGGRHAAGRRGGGGRAPAERDAVPNR